MVEMTWAIMGLLAKLLKGRVKISHGPFKLRYWSLDPTDRGLTGPHCREIVHLPNKVINTECIMTTELNIVYTFICWAEQQRNQLIDFSSCCSITWNVTQDEMLLHKSQ